MIDVTVMHTANWHQSTSHRGFIMAKNTAKTTNENSTAKTTKTASAETTTNENSIRDNYGRMTSQIRHRLLDSVVMGLKKPASAAEIIKQVTALAARENCIVSNDDDEIAKARAAYAKANKIDADSREAKNGAIKLNVLRNGLRALVNRNRHLVTVVQGRYMPIINGNKPVTINEVATTIGAANAKLTTVETHKNAKGRAKFVGMAKKVADKFAVKA